MIDTNIIEDDRKAMTGQSTQQAIEDLNADAISWAQEKFKKRKNHQD